MIILPTYKGYAMSSKRTLDCKKCLMSFPEGFVNTRGECVVCSDYRKKWLIRDYGEKVKELIRNCRFAGRYRPGEISKSCQIIRLVVTYNVEVMEKLLQIFMVSERALQCL